MLYIPCLSVLLPPRYLKYYIGRYGLVRHNIPITKIKYLIVSIKCENYIATSFIKQNGNKYL